jgi:hypothetical protein
MQSSQNETRTNKPALDGSMSQGRGRLHALIWRASSCWRSMEQGRSCLHASSWRVARSSALDGVGPRPPLWSRAAAARVSSHDGKLSRAALQDRQRIKEWQHPKSVSTLQYQKEHVTTLVTTTATSCSDGEGGGRRHREGPDSHMPISCVRPVLWAQMGHSYALLDEFCKHHRSMLTDGADQPIAERSRCARLQRISFRYRAAVF